MRAPNFLAVLLLAASANAATFIVPPDRELVAASTAIVVVTAGESHGRWGAGHWLETVTQMHVDECIKGPMRGGDTIDVTELGGSVGDLHYVVAGSPTYAPGEHLLLFLETNGRGEWTAKNMIVGSFSPARDAKGRRLLVRDAAELAGWDEDGQPHREPLRDEDAFLRFARATAAGEDARADYVIIDPAPLEKRAEAVAAAFSASSYGMRITGNSGSLPFRWNSFPAPVTFFSHGSQPGAVNGGLTALQRGLAAWTNDPGSNVVYSYGGTTAVSQGFSRSDSVNSVQFNDPSNEIPGSFTATGGATLAIGGAWTGNTTHVFAGEQFYTIGEADLIVQDGITGAGVSGNGLDHVLTHELGHTLGIRHSDQDAGEAACAPPLDCSQNAIMRSSVAFNNDTLGSSLQAWDIAAVDAIYGSGVAACNPPRITTQPQTVDVATAPVTFTAAATGDTPLQYQWYTGASGNLAAPIAGANGTTLTVKPSVTTAYWLRVTNGCDPAANSGTAYAIVNSCPPVVIASRSDDVSILEGSTATFSISAAGGTLSYQWYRGAVGITSSPIAGATGSSLTVQPASSAIYWVRIVNSCGSSVDSDAFGVTVTPCTAPRIAVQPIGGDVAAGTSMTLFATVTGTAPITYQWFAGLSPNTSQPVAGGTGPSLTLPPLDTPAAFWLRVSSPCGTADSVTAALTIVPTCVAPSIVTQPRSTVTPPGTTTTLSIAATGASLFYQWYEGPHLDFTRPRGGSSPILLTSAINAPTQFWVRITSPCGSIDSDVATVTPAIARRRAVH